MIILIAEDDRSFRKALVYELQDLGHTVQEAENGEEAIGMIRSDQFDLVISDLVMPQADGLEVFHVLQETSPGTQFILLSAHSGSDKVQAAKELLQENFIEKSETREFLFDRIEEILR